MSQIPNKIKYIYGTLPIEQSGLILDWDIQDPVSYNGSGTSIVDLEGNSNGSIVGTVDYNSGITKYFTIQGSTTEY